MIARKSIIFDELTINHSFNTPALEALDVAQPHGARYTGLEEVFVKYQEDMAKSKTDVLEVAHTRYLVVLLEADDGTNHLIIDRESLNALLEAEQIFQRRLYTPRLPDYRTYGRRPPLMI